MYFICVLLLSLLFLPFSASATVELTNITKVSEQKHTRIVFHLDQKSEFNIIPDPGKKRVLLNIPNIRVPFHVDRNLEDGLMTTFVSVSEQSGEMNAFISLKKDPFSFHYFLLSNPYRIVLDLKERDSNRVKKLQKFKKREKKESGKEQRNEGKPSDEKEPGKKKVKQFEKDTFISSTIEEEKKIYYLGLREFSQENYQKTIEAMESLNKSYPGSRYRGNSLYLIAESYLNLMKAPPPPEEDVVPEDYEQLAMDAFRIAVSKDPDNHRREAALFRTANMYLNQGKHLEAGSMFQMLVEEFPKGQFAPRALLSRAKIFSRDKRFDEAYNELEKVLFLYPFSPVIRGATYNIADSYYLEKDYKKAVEIYDQA
ncbi:MAG: tol-pal system YbgF family protein, partial [Nitrospinota bacterium]